MENNRYRRFTYTVNNYTQDIEKNLQSLKCAFHIYGREIASTGTHHLQGYLEFAHPRKFSSVIKMIPGHVEVAKKNKNANINYCTKEKDFWSSTSFTKNEPSWLMLEDKDLYMQDLHSAEKKIKAKRYLTSLTLKNSVLQEVRQGYVEKPRVIYISGKSGSGKTFKAIKIATENYEDDDISFIKWDNSGFAHVSDPNAPCQVIQEFRSSCLKASDFLELLDGYGTFLNIKHGSCFIRPKLITIASIIPPNRLYQEEVNFQFQRRIQEFINMDNNPFNDMDITQTHSDDSTIEE